jgi:hypothetical protein
VSRPHSPRAWAPKGATLPRLILRVLGVADAGRTQQRALIAVIVRSYLPARFTVDPIDCTPHHHNRAE